MDGQIRWVLTLLMAIMLTGCGGTRPSVQAALEPEDSLPAVQTAAAPSTRPVPAEVQASAPATKSPHAAERYRLVHAEDEIVSVLENGAVVIAKRVVGSPVLAVRGYVKTGGVYEGQWLGGGLSHLLEHLVAGGSNARRDEATSRALLQELGNNSNAYTTNDHTAYFINTTPAHLDKAVDLLTGWLLHASITREEFAREYEVVQRELEMGKGEPGRQFWYLTQMNRYQVSPARVPVIGYWEVIRGLSRNDVYRYYRQAYQPNNMVFALAGDLPPQAMLEAVQRYLDAPPGRVFDHSLPAEPKVLAPRTLVATMPKIGQVKANLAWPTIRLDHDDLYALDLLASVLGQSEGSLLVREVRDQALVSSISAYSATPQYVEGSFAITFEASPDKFDAALEAVQLVLDKVRRQPLEEQAIERAKTRMRVEHLRSQQQTANVAATLASDYLSSGDVHFMKRYLERIDRLTAADLQAVARKYLDDQKLIKTVMLPAESTQGQGLPAAEQILRQAGLQASTGATTMPVEESRVHRTVLENGTILLTRRVPTSPLIAVRLYALGGLTAEDEARNGIGNLTMAMLMRGTTFRSANQIAEELDAMGASVEASCGNNTWSWNATILRDDFRKGMELLADVVNNPAFAEDQLETMRNRVLAAIAAQDANWTSQAMRYFKKQYFAPDSPYRFQVIGEAENVRRFKPQDLRHWYQQQVLTSRRVLAIYGDIEPQVAEQVARELLGGGERLKTALPPQNFAPPAAAEDVRPQVNVRKVEVQKTQQPLAGVIIGFDANGVIGDPQLDTLAVADTVCSGWGYPTGYLHETLRGEGLVYVVAAQNWPGRSARMPGTFFVYAGCEPAKVNTVIDRMLENIARLQGTREEIQADWFGRAKSLLVTDEALNNETVGDQAMVAALDELWGLGYDYHDRFPQRVEAVTLEQMQAVARQRLRSCMVTVSTPRPDLVQIAPGERIYDSFPPLSLTPRGIEHEMPVDGQ